MLVGVSGVFDLDLSITNGIVLSKIYDKRDNVNFEIVKIPCFDGDVPCYTLYSVYIWQRFFLLERVCSSVSIFTNRLQFVINIIVFVKYFLNSTTDTQS